jgi:probable F420-dependent oxidoreductase
MELSGTGIWSAGLRYGDAGQAAEAAAELEDLGYSALWVPDVGGDLFGAVDRLLGATGSVTIATGILNLWMHEPADSASTHARFTAQHGDRFLVGIGVSHAPLIDAGEPGRYRKPLAAMRAYLDGLDAAEPPLPVDRRVLAALGPKMLALAGERTAGTHLYNVTPEHTAAARSALGDGALVLPEHAVAFTKDADEARQWGRAHLAGYLGLPNYTNNLRRAGFGDADLADGGSDRLVDALVAWGDEATIAAKVGEHRSAGADHVCIQVLGPDAMGFPLDTWRRLAPALTGS